MKRIILSVIIFGLLACNQPNNESKLQSRIDSLEKKLANTYSPGLGEFMNGIQAHHAKLWYAGENKNWKLAEFEVEEILELVEDIQKYKADRKETKLMNMVNSSLDKVKLAIDNKNLISFKSSFTELTNTCNSCHLATEHEFNVVQVPTMQMFSNQDFKAPK
jgi:superfamily I DNA/RNA helicase